MGRINVLDISVANLIAAGEVVERPSSAVKELVENSIDAGASQITVEIARGGVSLIRVTDNGCGMSGEDAVLAIRRHATSKLKNASDLDAIFTLGFRGEALAAITAVSEFRIMTRCAEDEMGTELRGFYGKTEEVVSVGVPVGTTVICEKLFATTPARLKFLKSDSSEGLAVAQAVEKLAVSHPEIAFRFISDGKTRFTTTGDGKLKNAVYSVYGSAFATKMIPVSAERGGFSVEGFVSAPDHVRGNRTMQLFFINSRSVRSKTMSSALEAAFHSYSPSDKFPSCVLNLKMPANLVDVNIHPAKLEVKFSNEKMVFDAVYSAVRSALVTGMKRPELSFSEKNLMIEKQPSAGTPEYAQTKLESLFAAASEKGAKSESVSRTIPPVSSPMPKSAPSSISEEKREMPVSSEKKEAPSFFRMREERMMDDDISVDVPVIRESPRPAMRFGANTELSDIEAKRRLYEPAVREAKKEPAPEPVAPVIIPESTDARIPNREKKPIPAYRIVGEVFASYVIIEVEGKMILVDKHAAHERINFERLRANMQETRNVQMLIMEETLTLSAEEMAVCREYREELEAVGFAFTMADATVSLQGIPENFERSAARELFLSLVTASLETGASVAQQRREYFEKALYQSACKMSVKAGRVYDTAHLRWICDNLLRYDCIKFCPHGRPVAFELSKEELDRRFGRT